MAFLQTILPSPLSTHRKAEQVIESGKCLDCLHFGYVVLKLGSQPNWSEQPACVLRWFAAMVSFMHATQVEKFLVHILSPVYRIAEDDTIRDPQIGKLGISSTVG